MKYIIKNVLCFLCFLFLSACGGSSAGGAPVSPLPQKPLALEEIHILVIGQSISSNCNQKIYGPINNVFQVGRSGEIKSASDPFEWADCKNGSMWMPLGRKLIEENIAKKVVFMPIGIAATKVSDWQVGGSAFEKLNSAIEIIKKNNINFDFVLWHQGSSDVGGDANLYKSKLSSVIDYVNGKIKADRWLIAVHSRCYGAYDRSIESAQLSVGGMNSLARYLGANNNVLGDDYRFDNCHLNERGQEAMANMWVDSIRAAVK